MPIERRDFLKSAGTGLAALTALQYSRVMGANDRVGVTVVGVGGRGKSHIAAFAKNPASEIRHVVDIDQAHAEMAVAYTAERQNGLKPKELRDMRESFDSKDIDVVSIATPNFWHALSTIWACQAGKDVYVEKPASHNIFEGRKMVEAARKYNRMVQVGQQSRSTPHKIEGIQKLREGIIGEVYLAKGLCFKRRKTIGSMRPWRIRGVDYDLWLGRPAARLAGEPLPLQLALVLGVRQRNIGNQGVHEMDVAHWGLGVGLPAGQRVLRRRQVRLRRRSGNAEHADRGLQVPPQATPVRSSRHSHRRRERHPGGFRRRRQHGGSVVPRQRRVHDDAWPRLSRVPGREADAGRDGGGQGR